MAGERAAGAALAVYPNPYGLLVSEIRDLAVQAGMRPSEYWEKDATGVFTNGQTLGREVCE